MQTRLLPALLLLLPVQVRLWPQRLEFRQGVSQASGSIPVPLFLPLRAIDNPGHDGKDGRLSQAQIHSLIPPPLPRSMVYTLVSF